MESQHSGEQLSTTHADCHNSAVTERLHGFPPKKVLSYQLVRNKFYEK